MTPTDVLQIAATILASLGGGAVIVFALSNFLGRVWANRLMEKDRAVHARELADLQRDNQRLLDADRANNDRELERLSAELRRANEESLDRLRSDLEIQTQTLIKEHADKLAIYRLVTDIVSDLLADLGSLKDGRPLPMERVDQFDRDRMKGYGYIAMLASQEVMDSYDRLIDYLLGVSVDKKPYEWERVRTLVLDVLNMIRADVGINKTPIEYHGERE